MGRLKSHYLHFPISIGSNLDVLRADNVGLSSMKMYSTILFGHAWNRYKHRIPTPPHTIIGIQKKMLFSFAIISFGRSVYHTHPTASSSRHSACMGMDVCVGKGDTEKTFIQMQNSESKNETNECEWNMINIYMRGVMPYYAYAWEMTWYRNDAKFGVNLY